MQEKVYSFSHLTFHDYFTAKYILEHQIENHLFETYLFAPEWKEIILLTSNMLTSYRAENFLRAIRAKIKTFANQKKLTDFLKTTDTLINPISPYNIELNRVLAIIEALKNIRVMSQDIHVNLNLFYTWIIARNLGTDLTRALNIDLNSDQFLYNAFELDWTITMFLSSERYNRPPDRTLLRSLVLSLNLDHNLDPDWTRILNLDHGRNRVLVGDAYRLLEIFAAMFWDTALAKALALDWYQDWELSKSNDRVHDLIIYLHANKLMINCIKTSYLSNKFTEEILGGILLED